MGIDLWKVKILASDMGNYQPEGKENWIRMSSGVRGKMSSSRGVWVGCRIKRRGGGGELLYEVLGSWERYRIRQWGILSKSGILYGR